MANLHFDNAFLRVLPGDPDSRNVVREVRGALWSEVMPTAVAAPRLLAYSPEMAATLGFDDEAVASAEFAEVFAGNRLLDGMRPYASNYGGHQFGQWAGQLGDGRAITLGTIAGRNGQDWELQLKGAGRTPYSRHADGRAVLRSSVREFLCSEAMHHLGIPTTRALSLVTTGEEVLRDMFYDGHPEMEAGAVVCRVAPSFLRFGHFELPSARGEVELLRTLVGFAIDRHFPELKASSAEHRVGDWFTEVCRRTARLVAGWMRVGFVHGVLNTDNMSILGLTIDYGPYGWIDDYDPDFTPNTTDAQGRRYRFDWQPRVAYWNLTQLARALSPLFDDVAPLQAGLDAFAATYAEAERENIAGKLGLSECRDNDLVLMADLQSWMQAAEADMTMVFRTLSDLPADALTVDAFGDVHYDAAKRVATGEQLQAWLQRYRQRLADDPLDATTRRDRMRAVNPKYILRNWLAQRAIERAQQGDPSGVLELLDVMRHPYDDQPGREAFAGKRPEWARDRAGCSMLSCSS
ncbi:protein adenylyltransferase SelO [Solilutibacter silvestris]|uniref:protein adenylyltransferase SelO n=1 Tax=Solilutibacter silvestris TaxID=1645665 RepID=UPI003D3468C3